MQLETIQMLLVPDDAVTKKRAIQLAILYYTQYNFYIHIKCHISFVLERARERED